MDTNKFLQDQITVEELLQRWPETWVVFMNKRTDCVGCFMQRFCSLQEVAEAYQLTLQDLSEELEKRVHQSKKSQRSIS